MSDRPPDSSVGPWDGPDEKPPLPKAEPLFNAPAIAVLLALSMPALFLVQLQLPDQGAAWALRPADVARGRWLGLFTAMLLHGGWAHVAMNAVAALTFGAPAARLMRGTRGAIVFLVFYIGCGLIAGLGFAAVRWDAPESAWGASGAVFGLIGASTRLMRGRLAPLLDRQVLTMSAAWMAVNLLTGLIGFSGSELGVAIAWEAHAFGFVAGILLIGPVARLFPQPTVAPEPPREDCAG